MKYLTIITGGAAIALVTQLGSWSRECMNSPDFSLAMGALVWALVFSIGPFFSTYFTQMNFLKLVAENFEDENANIRVYKFWHVVCFFITLTGQN